SFMFLLLVGLLFRLRCIFSSASEGFAGQHDFGSLWRRNSRGRSAEPTNAYNPNGKNLRTEMDWLPPMIQSDQWLFPSGVEISVPGGGVNSNVDAGIGSRS